VDAPSRNIAEGILEKARTGWSKHFLTTPSAHSKVASRHFLDRAATLTEDKVDLPLTYTNQF